MLSSCRGGRFGAKNVKLLLLFLFLTSRCCVGYFWCEIGHMLSQLSFVCVCMSAACGFVLIHPHMLIQLMWTLFNVSRCSSRPPAWKQVGSSSRSITEATLGKTPRPPSPRLEVRDGLGPAGAPRRPRRASFCLFVLVPRVD